MDVYAYAGTGDYTLTVSWGNGPGVYQDTSPAIRYGSSFTSVLTDASDWDGSVQGTVAKPALETGWAELSFSGAGVQVFSYKAPTQGTMRVMLDGVASNVNLYNSIAAFQQQVFEVTGLPSGHHTIRLEWTGRADRNAKRTQNQVNVDAIRVLALPPAAPTNLQATLTDATQVDLSWDAVTGAAGYNVYRSESAGGPYTKVTDTPVADTTYADTSTAEDTTYYYVVRAVDDAGQESDNSAEATISTVYPAPAAPANLQGTAASDTQVDLSWDAVPSTHVVGYNVYRSDSETGTYSKLNGASPETGTTYSDTTAAASTSYWYVVRAVDDLGQESADSNKVNVTTPAAPSAVGPGIYEENDPAVALVGGSWRVLAASTESGGSWAINATAGEYAELSFIGRRIGWLTRVAPGLGIVDVYIDDSLEATVDLYSASVQHEKLVFEKEGLSEGSHTIKLVATGNKNPNSGGRYASLDAFVVQSLYQENDPAVALVGGSWRVLAASTESGGSWAINATAGEYAELSFIGRRIGWLTRVAPGLGIVDVYIDDSLEATVDLYSASVQHEKLVFEKEGLSEGSHTIKLVATGNKNPNSGGRYASLDAFLLY